MAIPSSNRLITVNPGRKSFFEALLSLTRLFRSDYNVLLLTGGRKICNQFSRADELSLNPSILKEVGPGLLFGNWHIVAGIGSTLICT